MSSSQLPATTAPDEATARATDGRRPSAQPAPRSADGNGDGTSGKKIARGSGRRDATWARLESRRAPALALRHDSHERTPRPRPRRDRPFFCCTAPVAALVCIELCPFSGVWSCWSAASATTATRSRTRMMLGRDASHCRVQPYTRERRREEPI